MLPSLSPAMRMAAASRAVCFGPNIGTPSIAEFFEKNSLDRGNRVGLGVGIGKRQFKQPDFLILSPDTLYDVHRRVEQPGFEG